MLDFHWTWPVWVVVALGALLALSVRISTRVRSAGWTPLAALLLLLSGLWLCRFDAEPVLSDKFDFTDFAWTGFVVRRIPMSLALLLLGPLVARAAVDTVTFIPRRLAHIPALGRWARRKWDHLSRERSRRVE